MRYGHHYSDQSDCCGTLLSRAVAIEINYSLYACGMRKAQKEMRDFPWPRRTWFLRECAAANHLSRLGMGRKMETTDKV